MLSQLSLYITTCYFNFYDNESVSLKITTFSLQEILRMNKRTMVTSKKLMHRFYFLPWFLLFHLQLSLFQKYWCTYFSLVPSDIFHFWPLHVISSAYNDYLQFLLEKLLYNLSHILLKKSLLIHSQINHSLLWTSLKLFVSIILYSKCSFLYFSYQSVMILSVFYPYNLKVCLAHSEHTINDLWCAKTQSSDHIILTFDATEKIQKYNSLTKKQNKKLHSQKN